MRLGVLVFIDAARCSAISRCTHVAGLSAAFAGLVVLATLSALGPARAAQLEQAPPDLPWSALPVATAEGRPLQLAVPRIPIFTDDVPQLADWNSGPASPGIGTALWSSESGAVVVGFSVDQEKEEDYRPEDRMFGDLRKRYTAVFAFDQPLGFSTALIVDVLSKDKKRGQREFKILQVAVSRPFGEGGSLSGGTALLLDGLKPELNIGLRLFLPLGGP